jgi:O-antigen ligase
MYISNILNSSLKILILFLPISIILGNFIINLNSALIVILFFGIILINKKILITYKNFFIIFCILFLLLFLNIIGSSDKYLSIKGALGIVRYYLLFVAILYSFENFVNFKYKFSHIIFFVILFVTFDLFYQYFFTEDIFGYKVLSSHGSRLSGPFGDELVPGSYLVKLFFLSIFIFKESQFKLAFLYSLLILIVVILTNERSASIMLCFSLIIFSFLNIKKLLNKISIILITLFTVFFIFSVNKNLKDHFITIPIKYFQDNHYRAHYLTGISIFSDNKFLGSGIKTFRIECSKEKYENIKTKYFKKRCATHPHQVYIEFLSDNGLLGISILLFFNLFILRSLFFNRKKFLPKREKNILFCNYLILFWPLQTTGAFFSTWNGIFYWLFFAYFFFFIRNTAIKPD